MVRVARFFCSVSSSLSCAAAPAGCREPGPTPRPRRIASASATASVAACSVASAVAASTRSPAARSAALSSPSDSGSRSTAVRRSRASSSSASRRARPMWPCAARAANHAIPGSTPSRRTSTSATAAVGGVRSDRCRQRDRTVGRTSSTAGAHSSHTVCGVGSSIALSSALPAWSVSRSASSTTITCQRPRAGCRPARETRPRASSTPIESLRVLTTSTSGWPPDSTLWQAWHSPQPALRALQRGREGPRGGGPAGPGRAGEQPGVRHAGAGLAAAPRLGSPSSAAQDGDGGLLAHQVDPDPAGCLGHRSSRRWSTRGSWKVLSSGSSSSSTRCRTARRSGSAGRVGGSSTADDRRVGASSRRFDVVTATRVAMALLAGQPLLLASGAAAPRRAAPAARRAARGLGGLGRGDRCQPGALGGLGLLLDPSLLGQAPLPRRRPGPAGPRPRAASRRARSSASARARASSSRRASSAIRRRSSSAAGRPRLADLQRAQRQHRLEPGADRRGDLLGRQRAVDDEVAGAAPAGQVEEPLADPLVERHGSDSSRSGRARPGRSPSAAGTSRTTVRSRTQAVGRPARQPGDLGAGQLAPGALVGDRGVDVAVGDHDGPRASAGATTVATCWARSAANSSASVRGATRGYAGSLAVGRRLRWSSRTDRSRRPTSVAPGSRVTTTSWPSSLEPAAPAPAPGSTCRRRRRPRTRRRSRCRGPRCRAAPPARCGRRPRCRPTAAPATVVHVPVRDEAEPAASSPATRKMNAAPL